MDVRLELRDVADLQQPAGRRHDLHDADGTDRAPRVLIELGLLVSLSGHEQVIHLIPVAVLPKEVHYVQELLALLLGRGSLRVLRVDEVLSLDSVAKGRSHPVVPHERVQPREKMRVVLADGDGEGTAGAQRNAVVDDEVRNCLLYTSPSPRD